MHNIVWQTTRKMEIYFTSIVIVFTFLQHISFLHTDQMYPIFSITELVLQLFMKNIHNPKCPFSHSKNVPHSGIIAHYTMHISLYCGLFLINACPVVIYAKNSQSQMCSTICPKYPASITSIFQF